VKGRNPDLVDVLISVNREQTIDNAYCCFNKFLIVLAN